MTPRRPKPNSKAAANATPKARAVAVRGVDVATNSAKDWRAATLAHVRSLIQKAIPDIQEERKWIKPSNPLGVPVWSRDGIVCTGETYKNVVKLTFAKGASLQDPHGLFNSSLEGNTRRAIDIHEGETLNAKAFQALLHAAVAENLRTKSAKGKAAKTPAAARLAAPKPVRLLSGGNPQIAKGDGDEPVQAYIAAMPGWKREIGRWLDALITRHVPNVRKSVKWNSPFYGIPGQGYFLAVHCLTKYVKVSFFAGKSLKPMPPGGTPKSKETRWLDIYEDDALDDKQMVSWLKQAAALPGWQP